MSDETEQNFFKTGFSTVTPNINLPELEEEVLRYWKENKIFEKSVEMRPEDKTWTFLDGPPFVTGMPHYGSLLSSLPKDLFGRYWTMKGYRVNRVWGWDGHGLPIENKVENKLDIKSKKDIEDKVGIKTFIEECKKYVDEISGEWEWYVDRIGRWVDFKNAYKTWDTDYMESVMWVFRQMYDKGHIYKGLRVTLFCPHCSTPISNFEVAMDADNYKETVDHGTTYKYELEDEKDTYVLAWSTTPWNKIVTPALAVNPALDYVKVKDNDAYYILAKSTLGTVIGAENPEIVDEFKGAQLIGKKFIPHYDYYPIESGEKAFEIVGGEFVTADEGTGVVTIAAYGEEDLAVMKKENVHIEMHLDEEGMVKEDVPLFGGMYYLKANKAVNEDLEKRGLIYKNEEYSHKVPLCWRCHTRLYYAPIDAWYVDVQSLKERLKETNEEVNWFPEHFKYGRFLKSLENAPDWNISRNRYWGSPVPVWECPPVGGCGERFVPGSINELEERSGRQISDLHKPEIDEVTIVCSKCRKTVHRVTEVLDSWIEAGSASFAERHFPFRKDPSTGSRPERLEDFFPPDFIAEYTGQIRAWFYVLHVIGGALYDSPAFRNVSVTGVILGTDGRKMSKNLGNYPDPKEMLQKYGGDALRLYLMGSPVMNGEDIIISEEMYRQQVRGMLLILWNVYNFFLTYANVDGWKPQKLNTKNDPQNILDRWILSLLNKLISDTTKSLNSFDTVTTVASLQKFVTEFSTWYIRRSRDRVGPASDEGDDRDAFYETTFQVLTTLAKLMAPLTPFFSEAIYKNLTGEESVHLTDWPSANSSSLDNSLEKEMQEARRIVELAHAQRQLEGIKIREPLSSLHAVSTLPLSEGTLNVLKDEVNVLDISFEVGKENSVRFDFKQTDALMELGKARALVRMIQQERKKLGTGMADKVSVTLPGWPKSQEEYIKKHALVVNLSKGDRLRVEKA